MELYDEVLEAEFEFSKEPEDNDLAVFLSLQKEQYRFSKQYAEDTYLEQAGLTQEQIDAAENGEAEGEDDGIEP
jgi:hypothetical protein